MSRGSPLRAPEKTTLLGELLPGATRDPSIEGGLAQVFVVTASHSEPVQSQVNARWRSQAIEAASAS